GDLLDCFDLELIRVPLAAHTDLLGCHKLWLEDVYERLAGPGLTITFSDMKIASDGIGHSTITGSSNVNGPQANCASYLSANITYLPNATAGAH
ncbi:MAG: hypothetical protein IOC36_29865, partial [Burkholderia sp.]